MYVFSMKEYLSLTGKSKNIRFFKRYLETQEQQTSVGWMFIRLTLKGSELSPDPLLYSRY